MVVLNSLKGVEGILNHEPIVHANTVRQAAKVVSVLSTDDKALCCFRFLHRPEYLNTGMTILFREGRAIGFGRVTTIKA